jgi:hypothetical protein
MSFLKGGARKRRDGNEKAIVAALEAIGAEIYYINGRKLPDLLVRFRGAWMPIGVKMPKGALQPGEDTVSWPLVYSVDEALALFSRKQAEAIPSHVRTDRSGLLIED